jgi:hypothetical protein
MSTSTRENMRRELKELAKLAETMGKAPPATEESEGSAHLASGGLQRPSTPASSSRVSVPPVAFPSTPAPFASPLLSDIPPEPRKRPGFMAIVIGGSLAAALVGGAVVGKSLAGRSTTMDVPADTKAAAVLAPPPEPTPVVAPSPAAVQPEAPAVVVTPTPTAVAPKNLAGVNAPPPAAFVVHKHAPKPAGLPAPIAATTKPAAAAAPAAVAAGGDSASAPAVAKSAAPSAPAAKPAAAKSAAAGGGDSLEDLIRKEVAASKK